MIYIGCSWSHIDCFEMLLGVPCFKKHPWKGIDIIHEWRCAAIGFTVRIIFDWIWWYQVEGLRSMDVVSGSKFNSWDHCVCHGFLNMTCAHSRDEFFFLGLCSVLINYSTYFLWFCSKRANVSPVVGGIRALLGCWWVGTSTLRLVMSWSHQLRHTRIRQTISTLSQQYLFTKF